MTAYCARCKKVVTVKIGVGAVTICTECGRTWGGRR